MPVRVLRREAAALLGYVCVAVAFTWPLPLRLAEAMIGLPAGDAGVYVWNLWVFRHEIVTHHRLPFLTSEILALSQPVPLALHNYTTFANLLALPFIPIFGVVKTFNLLVIASGVMSGYAMYVYARLRTGDAAAAWVGGLLFGFSPFMSARASEHFSLTLTAPIPLFAWLMYRLYSDPSPRLACAAGATVAWAFLCDAYFAVYCLMIAVFTAAYSIFSVERQSPVVRHIWPRALVDLAILCVAGLIVGIVLRGGGLVDVLGIRVSFTRLYTPVLVFTVLVLLRAWMSIHPRIVRLIDPSKYAPAAVLAGVVCIAVLSPVLSAAGSPFSQRNWISPQILWRSSAPGLDLLAYLMPNPLHPVFGSLSFGWFASMTNGFNENVASIPWVAIATIAGAIVLAGFRPAKGWTIFTLVFLFLSLGPFVWVAKQLTYIPTPWTSDALSPDPGRGADADADGDPRDAGRVDDPGDGARGDQEALAASVAGDGDRRRAARVRAPAGAASRCTRLSCLPRTGRSSRIRGPFASCRFRSASRTGWARGGTTPRPRSSTRRFTRSVSWADTSPGCPPTASNAFAATRRCACCCE